MGYSKFEQGASRKDSLVLSLKATPRPLTAYAYLAGLIDGEGSIFVYRRQNKKSGSQAHVLSLTISMTSEETIRWIESTFGGRVLSNIPGAESHHLPQFRWHVENEAATEMLRGIYEYLVTKKRQAALAFKFREVMKQTFGAPRSYREGKRDELMFAINSLNLNKSGRSKRLAVEAVETVHVESASLLDYDPVRASEKSEEVLQATA